VCGLTAVCRASGTVTHGRTSTQPAGQGFRFADVRGTLSGHGGCAGGRERVGRIVAPACRESFLTAATGRARVFSRPVPAATSGRTRARPPPAPPLA
jgi:hypothetical protein